MSKECCLRSKHEIGDFRNMSILSTGRFQNGAIKLQPVKTIFQ